MADASDCTLALYHLKVRVKLKKFADLDFDLDPNWGITPKIERWLIYKNIEDIALK